MADLSAERVRFLFSYNPTTGDLRWKNPSTHRLATGEKAGVVGANGRVYVGVDGKRHLAHRIAWLYVHGVLPAADLSAKDGDYTNLRIDNYVEQTKVETARKNPLRSSNTSGLRGVIWDKIKGKWRAEITKDYKRIFIGYFDDKDDAAAAYYKACHADTKPADPEARRKEAARKLLDSQVRRLWRRLCRQNGALGWETFEAFSDDAREHVASGLTAVAEVPERRIGPGNCKWVPLDSIGVKALSRSERAIRDRLHRAQNPHVYKNQELKRAFGIDLDTYNRMLTEQNGVCAICKKPEVEVRRGKIPNLAVDHCHATGAVRSLLCIACNSGIARFKDDPDLMRAAAAYIERHAALSKMDAGTETTDTEAYAFRSKHREKER